MGFVSHFFACLQQNKHIQTQRPTRYLSSGHRLKIWSHNQPPNFGNEILILGLVMRFYQTFSDRNQFLSAHNLPLSAHNQPFVPRGVGYGLNTEEWKRNDYWLWCTLPTRTPCNYFGCRKGHRFSKIKKQSVDFKYSKFDCNKSWISNLRCQEIFVKIHLSSTMSI